MLYEIELDTPAAVYPDECCCCGLAATTTVESDWTIPALAHVAQHFPSCGPCAPHFYSDLRGGWARIVYNAFLAFAGTTILIGSVVRWLGMPDAVIWSGAVAAALLVLVFARKPPRRLPDDRPHARPFAVALQISSRWRLVVRFTREPFARRFRELNAQHVVRVTDRS